MVKRVSVFMFVVLLCCSLCLCACGQEKENVGSSPGASQPSGQGQPGEEDPDWYKDPEKYKQHFGIEIPELDTSKEEAPENVILVGARLGDYQNIYEQVNAFNMAQSDYMVKVKGYETMDAMLLDLVRGQGCDLLLLRPLYLATLMDKGGLEELSPYLEKSEKVNRGDLFEAVLEAGTAGGKLSGIMPGFTVDATLVEKGYTKDGGWTIEEYLALMDKYPDVPLTKCTDPKDALSWLMTALSALPESFVNWEERSCSFESEGFIQAIEMLKNYMERRRKTDGSLLKSSAQMLYEGQVQTATVNVGYEGYFSGYRDIRDAFLGAYELAGFPNQEGEVRYPVPENHSVVYSMNAASAKKGAAWTFLEYLLSDYQETMADSGGQLFPVRRDIVERKLQEEIDAELTDKEYRINSYSREMLPKRGNFTEEDKERVLYILNHASPPTILQAGGVFWSIITEELGAFFAGDKTAEETARIIQNRVTTYLSE